MYRCRPTFRLDRADVLLSVHKLLLSSMRVCVIDEIQKYTWVLGFL